MEAQFINQGLYINMIAIRVSGKGMLCRVSTCVVQSFGYVLLSMNPSLPLSAWNGCRVFFSLCLDDQLWLRSFPAMA